MTTKVTRVRAKGGSRNSEIRRPEKWTDDQITRDLLTPAEVAERLRQPVGTLGYWRHIQYGPHFYNIGRRVVYPEYCLNEWLREQHDLSVERRQQYEEDTAPWAV